MDSLLLSCRALSSPTTCRFIPALSGWPTIHPERHNAALAIFHNLKVWKQEGSCFVLCEPS